MSTLDDLQRIREQEQYVYRNPGVESLLDKYRIPIQHFDFNYVNGASDANEMEKIVEILRSGQEGYFPDLLRVCEERLRLLRPHSRFLRQTTKVLWKHDLRKEDRDGMARELQEWVLDMTKNSKELDQRKTHHVRCDVKIRQADPQPEPLNLVKNKNEKRISSTDYRAWDRYDPDTELMKLTLKEEKMRRDAQQAQQAARKLKEEAEKFAHAGTSSSDADDVRKTKKSVSFNRFPTEAEALFVSDRELEKGREFFRGGDYELALRSFTQSVLSRANVVNLNNRALTCLKLNRFAEALGDCERALAIDGKNVKALMRKAQALEGLKKYEEALDCVGLVIEKDPNNAIAQQLAERVRKFCRNVLKNTRMKIVEIE